jgi:hypothetical protein
MNKIKVKKKNRNKACCSVFPCIGKTAYKGFLGTGWGDA